MAYTLFPQQLTLSITSQQLGFSDTSELAGSDIHGGPGQEWIDQDWIGQANAEKAARFGLSMAQAAFHLLVLGEPGSGRSSLMLSTMHGIAASRVKSPDLLLLFNFEAPEKPLCLYVHAGQGAVLRSEMDGFIRQLAKILPVMLSDGSTEASAQDDAAKTFADKAITDAGRDAAQAWITEQVTRLMSLADKAVAGGQDEHTDSPIRTNPNSAKIASADFSAYMLALQQDILDNLELFLPGMNADNDGLLESFLGRYRLNLLVDNRHAKGAPVIVDDDPSLSSLFGCFESGGEHQHASADFMRLRAGNLLRAHGGFLMLHLRDIQADQQNGSQILEKLHRVLRNHKVQIEESGAGSGQSTSSHFAPEALPVELKLVLIATREEYYALHDELPDFASYFSIKVDFSERLAATNENYLSVAHYIARECTRLKLKHFSVEAVARLLVCMHRKIDDQSRISSNFGYLQALMMECAAYAAMRNALLVEIDDVEAALDARLVRYQQPEQQLAEAIADGELMVSVHGTAVGQINGLTHIDLGDACFGSPVRISARCYAGDEGVINIDREVEMTGPNHDKGLFILRSWLSATFSHLTPLSLSASLVFEQEYHGVEGDSASCAELYALLSALSSVAIPQGLAVTGAMNQHGAVMAIGGVNEKIEGYFRICKRLGLDGHQGVIIPASNQSHLVLNKDVVEAVEQGHFHIYAVDTVLEGIGLLTDLSLTNLSHNNLSRTDATVTGRSLGGIDYHADRLQAATVAKDDLITEYSLMGQDGLMEKVQQKLDLFRKCYAANRANQVNNKPI